MASNVQNIRIEPMDVTWQIEEQDQWDFKDATAAGLGGKYVVMYLPTGVGYYAWFDENNTDVDPAPGGGLTAIEVNYAASASASAIATAFEAAVDAVTGFDGVVDGTVVTITRTAVGDCADSTLGNVTSGITLTKCQDGKDVDLGSLQGDIEVSLDPATFEVKEHQSGETILAELRQGESVSITMTLQESDNPLRKALFKGTSGGTFTPSGGTELYGLGDSKLGFNTIIDSARLILHPVSLGGSDYSRDWCFWKAYPLIESITFSGTDPEVMSISFKCYKDDAKPSAIRIFAIGNHTQAGITA
jgi:hypothetical protein